MQRGKSHPWIVCTLGFERRLKSFDKMAQEIISSLAGQHGTTLRVTIDIEAERPEGFTESTMRTVTENARTLKITDTGFE